jgi:Flp pilus assembly protein TadG
MKNTAQRGQVLPLVALCLVVLLGAAALAVDAGYLQYKQRVQQTAADAAALAGAWQVVDGAGHSQITAAAQASSSSNSFANAGNVAVTVNWPPATGPNNGNDNAVEVVIKATYPAIFSAVLGRPTNDVSTRAVAVVESNPSNSCLDVMDKDLTMSSPGSTLTATCGVMVNRNVNDTNATMNVPYIGAVGNAGKSISGVVTESGIPPFSDPCSTIPGCKALVSMYPLGSNVANEGPYSNCAVPSGSTLNPGCYTKISNDTDLSPGLYVISGDLTGNLTCSTCTSNGTSGTGMTLVVGGKINFNGSTTTLVAPPKATGTGTATVSPSAGAPGVLIYQTSTQTNPENFSAQSLLGMLYAPNAHIDLNGGGSTVHVSFVVAADLIGNNGNISVDNGGFRSLTQTPVLSE